MPANTLLARAIFCTALVLFIALKIPHLSYAFYWDESWVYAPAIYSMYDHGASILPSSIPAELSRGHPLLFHAAYVLWMKLTGATNCSMHLLSLIWSVGLAISVYTIMARRFGEETALVGTLILLCTHEFFMASTFVLNDIMLGWLSLLAIHSYAQHHIRITALLLTMLLLTKESGVVTCLAINIDAVWQQRKQPYKLLPRWPIFIIPGAVFSLLLAIQKYQLGWFFYPNHVDLIRPGLLNTIEHMQAGLKFIFVDNGAWVPCSALGLICFVAYLKTRQKRYLALPIYLVLLFANVLLFSYKDAIFYAFLSVSFFLFIWYIPKFERTSHPENAPFLRVALWIGVIFLYFCCINFFETRYLFPSLLIIHIILVPACLHELVKKAGISFRRRYVLYFAIPLLLATYNRNFVEYDRMWVHQDVVRFLESKGLYKANICSPFFFERIHLTDPKTGYRSTKLPFSHISENIESQTQFVVLDNMEDATIVLQGFEPGKFRLLHAAKRGDANALIYCRK